MTGAVTLLFPRLAFADDSIALRCDGVTLTYRELASACALHAQRLERWGVAPGGRVGVFTHPGMSTLVALAGNAAAGFVSVPLNPKLGPRELGHILSDAAPELVLSAQLEADAERVRAAGGATERVRLLQETFDEPGGGDSPTGEVGDEPALVLYTSGTTGAPKGAVLTRRNVAANIDMLADAWSWTDADRVVHALPLFHVHGLVLGLFGSLRVGGALEHLPRFTPEGVCSAVADGATMLFAVPTMYHRIAEALEADSALAASLSKARLLVSGSAGLPLREHRRLAALLGRPIFERYGLTETLIDCAVRVGRGAEPGRVGPALRGVELRLVDDAGEPVPRDDQSIGEVLVRGANVFAGYLNRPEATAAVLHADGWFRTGDLATWRGDGSVRIVGRRATDLLKTGGYKVGAGEVEACLLEQPGVREVAVVGASDDDLGQRIVAFVVPADEPPDAQALIDAVARELTPHKRPREVRFLEALPKNAMGKVMKRALLDGLDSDA